MRNERAPRVTVGKCGMRRWGGKGKMKPPKLDSSPCPNGFPSPPRSCCPIEDVLFENCGPRPRRRGDVLYGGAQPRVGPRPRTPPRSDPGLLSHYPFGVSV